MSGCVLDTSAILAYVYDEHGAATVEEWIEKGAAASTLTAQETISKLAQNGMPRTEAEEVISSLGLVFHALDLKLAIEAGMMFPFTKAYGLSHGDRACLALTKVLAIPVLTADKAWSKVAEALDVEVIQFR